MDTVRDIPDDKWLAMLTESVRSPVVEGIESPRFPSIALQTMLGGSANREPRHLCGLGPGCFGIAAPLVNCLEYRKANGR
jgi:hypothetical protein